MDNKDNNSKVFNSCCFNCQRFGGNVKNFNTKEPCVIDNISGLPLCYPQDNKEECEYIVDRITIKPDIEQYVEDNKPELKFIDKNKDNLDKMEKFEPHVDELPRINIVNKETGKTLTDEEYKEWKNNLYEKIKNSEDKIYEAYGLKKTPDGKVIDKDIETPEDMLLGDIRLSHFEQVTPWYRALNAARRTVGKEPLIKDPSPSWEAKVLLAEHSPIRLVEYDFGWKKIRQWVTAHMVRHHEGCEKFVHSQRGDRRELPCDRDHIYQGAKNDMDMSCNAQAMINISRKRLCNCASKETREAWKLVMDKLEKHDSILRKKCVPECIYRGFCPELKSCGFYKTIQFKKDLAEYRRIKYGKEIQYYCIVLNEDTSIIVSNTGHIYYGNVYGTSNPKEGPIPFDEIQHYQLQEYKYEIHKWYNGNELCIDKPILPVASLVYSCFSNEPEYFIKRQAGQLDVLAKGENIIHIDGNIYNNDIDNLINDNIKKEEV